MLLLKFPLSNKQIIIGKHCCLQYFSYNNKYSTKPLPFWFWFTFLLLFIWQINRCLFFCSRIQLMGKISLHKWYWIRQLNLTTVCSFSPVKNCHPCSYIYYLIWMVWMHLFLMLYWEVLLQCNLSCPKEINIFDFQLSSEYQNTCCRLKIH